jgi:transcriptional regulator with XRE-family HTH domain
MPLGIEIDGSALRALRRDQLWSQQELADRCAEFARAAGDPQCGITRETVSKLERGQRSPTPPTLRYLIGALRPDPGGLRRLLGRDPPRALVGITERRPAYDPEGLLGAMLNGNDLSFPGVRLSDLPRVGKGPPARDLAERAGRGLNTEFAHRLRIAL